MDKKTAVFLLIVLVLFSVSCTAQVTPTVPAATNTAVSETSSEAIRIAVDSGNPPFMYEQNGRAAGLYPRLLAAIFQRMGVEVQIEAVPWKRALEMGAAGKTGVGGIYKNEERLKIYDYSDPIYSEKLLVYVRKGNSFAFNDISDLEGKTVGAILGWSYGDAFDQARQEGLFTVEDVPNDEANFQKLLLGRVDCVIAIALAGDQLLPQLEGGANIEALATPLAINDTYLVFAQTAQQHDLLQTFNATLAEMKKDGSFAAIVNAPD